MTAPYSVMFRQDTPGPKDGVEAPFASLNREDTEWSTTVSKDDLARIAKLDKVVDLEVFKASDRVHTVRMGDSRRSRVVDFFTLQEHLGKNNLKSSDFTIDVDGDNVTFVGHGTGHGVGLCVYSAKKMVAKGDNAAKVLSEFFPDSVIHFAPNGHRSVAQHR
jgi:SpoIID/LytB domain protein